MKKTITWDSFALGKDVPKIFDPAYRRVVYDELPTVSIKRFKKRSDAITTEDIASAYFGSGSTIRVTRLKIWSSLGNHFGLKDQSGTIDEIYPGSSTDYFLGGAPKEPIYDARTHFTIFHVGSLSAGTVIVAFQGYEHPAEVGFAHRGGR